MYVAAVSEVSFADSKIDSFIGETTNYNSVLIDKVVRVDTIVLETGQKIKLIGLNAPELPKIKDAKVDSYGIIIEEVNPVTTIEEQALDFAKSLLEKKRVRLEFDVETKDRDFHTLAYVFLPDGTLANVEIIRQGFADLKIMPPNTKYAKELRAAYQEARREKRGLRGE